MIKIIESLNKVKLDVELLIDNVILALMKIVHIKYRKRLKIQ